MSRYPILALLLAIAACGGGAELDERVHVAPVQCGQGVCK
jgi:hypothetical protein